MFPLHYCCLTSTCCESVLASILMISCSLQPRLRRCSGTSVSVVYRTCPLGLSARPGDAPVCVCLSAPRPDHAAPATSVLVLPSGYNYSAFSRSLSPPRVRSSPWAWLDLDTEVHSEGRGAVALCSQHAERHWLHCGSKQVGGRWCECVGGCYSLDAKASGLEGRWGRRAAWKGPAAQQPTYLPLPFALL